MTLQAVTLAQAAPPETGAAAARIPETAPVSLDDLAPRQFRDLMGAVTPGQGATQVTSRSEALASQRSLGDAILTGLTQLTTNVQQAWAGVHAGMASGVTQVSLSEIYAKQVQLMDFTLQYQTIGHGLSKANQDLNELIKLQ